MAGGQEWADRGTKQGEGVPYGGQGLIFTNNEPYTYMYEFSQTLSRNHSYNQYLINPWVGNA